MQRAAIALMLLTGASAVAAEPDPALEAARAKISEMFEMIEPEDVGRSPIDGWYTIQKGSVVAYVSADARFLLQGDLIDLDSQVNLTEMSRNDARRDLMATLTDADSIVFSPAEARHEVTIFTDIDCTYCRRMHSQIDQYLEQGIAVRYLLYPRSGPNSRSWSTSEDVWCANNRNDALTAAKLDREFATQQCDASMISKHYSLGREVGLSGTPAIVLEDGTLIGGYLPPAQLGARLNQAVAHP
ncbi:MAG: thioredoxin fold domain-containing protein [Gammaproteobacteria bacterium]|nr:thioredoxin fold domain-containing protein [Gammaproteobacteria bacterium]NNF48244.1 thioredoxin fold domain-containing protein [Woeseiaceae bacterium]MBT8094930.1 thioredoxin fold domain-containing protein [Gammaproteobacteria bacterium]MBT8105469.1 thioredoxin fold domain-containing protein [Gammaproteobacteria bacterium]NNK25483.1 thioredoxin fold domain-containing protein [Woeseiaceae bacterium]